MKHNQQNHTIVYANSLIHCSQMSKQNLQPTNNNIEFSNQLNPRRDILSYVLCVCEYSIRIWRCMLIAREQLWMKRNCASILLETWHLDHLSVNQLGVSVLFCFLALLSISVSLFLLYLRYNIFRSLPLTLTKSNEWLRNRLWRSGGDGGREGGVI